MKHLLASTCLVAGLLAMTGAARAECGDVTIASMNWQSAEVLAALDKFILTEGYGCNAEVIVGDTVPTITSMIEK
ncbi:MAG: ABC transporter substrate-binding protein, partial [Proteobacteria bacterium]|nr:ABC transporter substrate-binding protein [Pseudomonadota bacterium]